MPARREEFTESVASSQEASEVPPRPGVHPRDAILVLFPDANPRAAGLQTLIFNSTDFALVDDGAGQVVIDAGSFIRGIVVSGVEAGSHSVNSAAWTLEAISEIAERNGRGGYPAQATYEIRRKSALEVTKATNSGHELVLSRTIVGSVIPRAIELSQATVGRERYDQRHLIAALLEQPPEKWSAVGIDLTPEGFAKVREHLVEMIGRNPDKGEDMDAWRTHFLGQAAQQQQRDFLAAQRDHPSLTDDLNRGPFAQVLANRLVEVRPSQEFDSKTKGIDRAFMVNLDGPWGSGKSTIVNFIKADLKQRNPKWLTVDFNAWRGQRIKPAWWGIISQIATQVPPQLGFWRGLRFRILWFGWKLRNDFAPLALALLLFLLAGLLWSGSSLLGISEEGKIPLLGIGVSPSEILTFITTFAGAATLARHLFFGSSKAGEAMASLSEDPYIPVVKLFDKLVSTAERPILVVIDDIDRCSDEYVVDLLEDIQTMLREAPISYLVVGDRAWITTSFKNRYKKFEAELNAPGRPIGHQFIDKVFQLSVSVPTLSRADAEEFWQSIVNHGDEGEDVAAKRSEARGMLAKADTEQELQAIVGQTDDPALRRAVAAEAAIRVSSPEFAKGLESRYAKYGPLLDRNPRSIKRLVNKLAINQSVMLLEEREIVPGPLARWTILELRWPQLAECLIQDPDLLNGDHLPHEHLQDLWQDRDFREVVGEDGKDGLSGESLRSILGR